MALQLADFFAPRGWRVSLYALKGASEKLFPSCDSKIVRHSRCPIEWWMQDFTHILWTEPPDPALLAFARQAGMVTTVLLPEDSVTSEDLQYLAYVDNRIVFTQSYAKLLTKASKHSLSTMLIPWHLPLSRLRPKKIKDNVRVALPMMDTQPMRSSLDTLEMFYQLLTSCPQMTLCVLKGSRWNKEAVRTLKQMRKQFTNRIEVFEPVCPYSRHRFLSACHLSLWPAIFEGLALFGLSSLTAGVPVVAWDVSPINEVLDTRNSLLLPCETVRRGLTWTVKADVAKFYDASRDLINTPERIDNLAVECHYGSSLRQQAFNQGWQNLWE